MPKGCKYCPQCETGNGCRSLRCKNCGYEFMKSKQQTPHRKPEAPKQTTPVTRKPTKKINWRELERGQHIHVKKGSGPYMLSSEGDKISIGHHGSFRVHGVASQGLHCYNGHGHSFIWMADEEYCEETGVYRRPHKIKLVKVRQR